MNAMNDSDNKRSITVAIATLGCKVNQFETAAMQSDLAAREAIEFVPFSGHADLYIINTCAVTAKAAAQSRQLVRRAARANPEARIVATGCYAQVASQEILEMCDSPVCIVGNAFKDRLAEIVLSEGRCDLEMYVSDMRRQREISMLTADHFPGRTRAFLKVQDGCNQFCSYCIVPFSRGASRSVPLGSVLAQAEIFAGQGFREIVLTGIHLGHYGLDLEPRIGLEGLLQALLDRGHSVRYRISSLEPTEVSSGILEMMRHAPQLMPYLHIPLQSGDDHVLKMMNRRYTRDVFASIVKRCAAQVPDAAIGVDVLVGFPGESEKAFQNTYNLIGSLPVSYLHVFPYSPRPGTVAAGLPDQVPKGVKEERVALLRDLDHKKRTAFYSRNIGKTHQVLVEGRKRDTKLLRGFTENYIPVNFEAPQKEINSILTVQIERIEEGAVFGRLAG
jgi:threonylcarbamoyladenosine tRNA methylthiotransferase MtaB